MSHFIARHERKFFVYFLLATDGSPVYIGRSCRVRRRIRTHELNQTHPDPVINTSDWYPLATSLRLAGPYDWDGAHRRETDEIMRHQPRGNVAMTSRDYRPAIAARSAERSKSRAT